MEYRFKGYRRRQIHGLFVKVELKRAYYVGPRGNNCHPLDERLALKGHSPGLQYFLALSRARISMRRLCSSSMRSFVLMARTSSMRKALDMDYELGEGLEGLRQQEIEEVLEHDHPIAKQAPIEGVMAVSIDATKVREKLGQRRLKSGRKRYEIGFKDAKVATVSSVIWDQKRGEASCLDSSYVSAVEEADQFFNRIWVEMQRRGVNPENQALVILRRRGLLGSGTEPRIWATSTRSRSWTSTTDANTCRISARSSTANRPHCTTAISAAGQRSSIAVRRALSSRN